MGIDVRFQTHRFVEFFKGFENVESVIDIFGDETEKVLDQLKVEFVTRLGYMGVNNLNGNIIISANYLKQGDLRDIYLDIIHELVHVKQFREGRKLFDRKYGYTERETEIEAYRHAVKEARNIGMTDKEIFTYLKTEWINEKDHRKLAKLLNVEDSEEPAN
jgi:hypothetical protein